LTNDRTNGQSSTDSLAHGPPQNLVHFLCPVDVSRVFLFSTHGQKTPAQEPEPAPDLRFATNIGI